jgi:hypothetical protein
MVFLEKWCSNSGIRCGLQFFMAAAVQFHLQRNFPGDEQ